MRAGINNIEVRSGRDKIKLPPVLSDVKHRVDGHRFAPPLAQDATRSCTATPQSRSVRQRGIITVYRRGCCRIAGARSVCHAIVKRLSNRIPDRNPLFFIRSLPCTRPAANHKRLIYYDITATCPLSLLVYVLYVYISGLLCCHIYKCAPMTQPHACSSFAVVFFYRSDTAVYK